jgi:hypothetical protein
MKLSEIKPESKFFGLFIGRSSSGKTSAAISFPDPTVLDFDLRILGARWTHLEANYLQFPPGPGKGWAEVDKYMEDLQIGIISRQTVPKTLVMDSITSMLRLFVAESMDLTKGYTIERKGKEKNALRLEGPSDYKYESSATYQVFDFLRSLPINVIISAHIIDKFGKLSPDEEYSETGVVGSRLSIRDKIAENILTYFNEVYEFGRKEKGNKIQHYVKFQSDICRSALGLPAGEHDITGKNFYEFWKEQVSKIK